MSESDPLGNHLRYVRNITAVTHEIIKSGEIQKCGELVVYPRTSEECHVSTRISSWTSKMSCFDLSVALLRADPRLVKSAKWQAVFVVAREYPYTCAVWSPAGELTQGIHIPQLEGYL